MAGAGGFEPPHGGIKIHCLTAWRRPNARLAPDSPCRRADHKAGLAQPQLPWRSFPVRVEQTPQATESLSRHSGAWGRIAGRRAPNRRRCLHRPLLPPTGASIRPALCALPCRCRSVAQSGSAPRSGRGGRRFESYHSDQLKPRKPTLYRAKPPGNREAVLSGRLPVRYCTGGAQFRLFSLSLSIADRWGNSSTICDRPKRDACSRPKSAMRYRPHRLSNCSGFSSRK